MIDVLEEMIKNASKRAEKCFKKNGEVLVQYRALCGDGEWITLVAPFANAMERDISRMMVRVLFEERNVQRYVHIAEACRTGKRPKLKPLSPISRPKEIIGNYGSMFVPMNGTQARN